jgi:hypothetical protein
VTGHVLLESFRRVRQVVGTEDVPMHRRALTSAYAATARAYAAGSIDETALVAAEESLIKDWLHAELTECVPVTT